MFCGPDLPHTTHPNPFYVLVSASNDIIRTFFSDPVLALGELRRRATIDIGRMFR